MQETKFNTKENSNNSLSGELNFIDKEIAESLLKRISLVENFQSPDEGINPKRELEILNSVLNDTKSKIPSNIIFRIWRQIIAYSFYVKNSYHLCLADNEALIEKSKAYFGDFSKIIKEKSCKTSVDKIVKDNKNDISVCFLNDEFQSDGWWTSLIGGENTPKIFAKIDFSNDLDSKKHYYSVGNLDTTQNYDFDRTFLVVETQIPVHKNWLTSALYNLEIPVYKVVESVATYKGSVLNLVEITGSFDMKKEQAKINNNISDVDVSIKANIGGYFDFPFKEEDGENIIDFNLLSKALS